MDWLSNYLPRENDIPRPNWEGIYEYTDAELSHLDQDQLWSDIARYWVEQTIRALPTGYSYSETENFILVSKVDQRQVTAFSGYLERCMKRLLGIMKGIADEGGYGKYVVMLFDNVDTYYDYVSYYYGPEEGNYALSGGMFLNHGYGHFVFPHQDIQISETTAAHEMTHALVDHLPIPAWLNEGLAVNMESMITGFAPPRLDREMFEKHESFWGEQEMQEFWQGMSFSRPDEGQELSYQLAQILVTNLSDNYDAFVKFTNKAHWQDGGEQAAEEIFDISLGDIIANFLGEGEWWPEPTEWNQGGGNNFK